VALAVLPFYWESFLLGSMALCVVPTFLHACGVAIEQPARLYQKVNELSGRFREPPDGKYHQF